MILQTIFSSTISLEVSIDHYKMVFPVEVNEESGKIEWKAGRKRIKRTRKKRLHPRKKRTPQFLQSSRWKKHGKLNEK